MSKARHKPLTVKERFRIDRANDMRFFTMVIRWVGLGLLLIIITVIIVLVIIYS